MKELRRKLYVSWLAKSFISLLVLIVRYPLAFIVVAFFSTEDKRNITRFKWLMTIDNDLSGDSGWKEEHLWGIDPMSYINRVRWLWRNGGNSLNYNQLGIPEDGKMLEDYTVYDLKGRRIHTWILRKDGFLFRRFYRLSKEKEKYLEVFIGWAIEGPQSGRCKIVHSVRGRTSVN